MLKLYIHRLWLKIIKRASEVCKCKANRIKKRQLLENICVWFEQLAVSVFMVTGPVLVHGCVAYLTADHASFTGRTSSQSHPFQWQHLSTIIPCGNWGTCGEHTDMGWFPSLEKLALKLQTWLKQSPQEQGAKMRQIMGELWQRMDWRIAFLPLHRGQTHHTQLLTGTSAEQENQCNLGRLLKEKQVWMPCVTLFYLEL